MLEFNIKVLFKKKFYGTYGTLLYRKKIPNMLILKFLWQRINATSINCTFFRQGSTLNILIGKKKWYSRSFGTAAEHKNIVFTIYYIYRVS